VCGNTAFHRRTFLVPNVHEFPGHIACDSASNSEVVIPILNGDHLVGVLDLDSPNLNRFDTQDQSGVELMVATFIAATDLPAKA
ncbi:MAG: GAF domain-containing protein, partial [Betaproteobacteria bacterium]